ncbi:CAP domain-containing protein [Thiohalocapsa sp. ML1]|uniref:CAP domain-containing protein n=1 Tax=Thiohalocapsa sp. ML1 TaxID=1431688 RepID=UPI0007323D2A|nr:CAP domain-containing protein [Thiohalocapsa sp. ML1]
MLSRHAELLMHRHAAAWKPARDALPALWIWPALTLIAGLGALPATAAEPEQVPRIEQQVLGLVNEYRDEQGLPRLISAPAITEIARGHSRDMADRGAISHRGFEGRFKALQEAVKAFRAAAENVAMNQGHADPAEQAVSGWLGSPGHRKNIVGDYGSTGVGIVRDADGAVWITQLYVRTR